MNIKYINNSIDIIPEEIIQCKPYIFNNPNYDFMDYRYKIKDTGLYKLQNIKIANNAILDTDDMFLSQFTWFEDQTEEYNQLLTPLINDDYFNHKKKLISLKGNCIYLGSTWGLYNIGHSILDGFSRLYMYQKYKYINLDKIDYILIHKTFGDEIDFLINLSSLDRNKIVPIDNTQNYLCKNLFISEMIGRKRQYKTVLKDFYTKLYPRKKNDGSRLFIIRKNFRCINNLSEVIATIRRYNFRVCYDFPGIDDFAKADIIISPNSATLTKLIFCNDSTKFIELISESHQYSYFYEICRIMGIQYTGLICKTDPNDQSKDMKKNFTVDIESLKTIIESNI